MTGTITEHEADLQAEIQQLIAERDVARTEKFTEQGRAKKLEMQIAVLQDELAKFRAVPPAPVDDRSELEKFMAGE